MHPYPVTECRIVEGFIEYVISYSDIFVNYDSLDKPKRMIGCKTSPYRAYIPPQRNFLHFFARLQVEIGNKEKSR